MFHSDFIELDRQFTPRHHQADRDILADQSVSFFWDEPRHQTLEWSDIHEEGSAIAVVLGEPGSGRTYEFSNQASSLREDGKFAFRIQLTDLASALDTFPVPRDDRATFQRWSSGSQPAWFFLDAIDEAKLDSPAGFRNAIRNFADLIGEEALSRCRILLSCRVHQWEPMRDAQALLTALGATDFPILRNPDDLPVFVILPLDESRIQRYAEEKIEGDVSSFLDAIKANHLWDFAGRPYDVDFLLSYWSENRRLSSLDEMTNVFADRLLEERRAESEAKFTIEYGKLREGAEALAAATVFCKKLDFHELGIGSEEGSLSASRILGPRWTNNDIQALLDRPLFTTLSFRKVRFQHRRTAEYLAACWLERHASEISSKDLEELFFAIVRGDSVVCSTRAAVAVWLCQMGTEKWVEELKSKLIATSPDVFFRHGDPELLLPQTHVDILDRFVAIFSAYDSLRLEIVEAVASRFTSADVGKCLSKHLSDSEVPPGIKIDLLKFAEAAHLSACAEAAIPLVFSDSTRLDLPYYAYSLISECGALAQKEEVAARLEELRSPSPYFIGQLIQDFFPSLIEVEALRNLLLHAGTQKDHFQIFYYLERKVEEIADQQLLFTLGELLIELCDESTDLGGIFHSEWASMCGDVAVAIFRASVMQPCLSAAEIQLFASLFRCLRRDDVRFSLQIRSLQDEAGADIFATTIRHPELRRIAFRDEFLSQCETAEASNTAMPDPLTCFEFQLGLSLEADDAPWVIRDAEAENPKQRATAAFILLIELIRRGKVSRSQKLRIFSSAPFDPGQRRELQAAFRFYRLRHWRAFQNRLWTFRARLRRRVRLLLPGFRSRWHVLRSSIWVACHISRIARGNEPGFLHTMIGWSGQSSSTRYLILDLDELKKVWRRRLGPIEPFVTRAFQAGCIEFWSNSCSVPDEEFKPSLIGAAGISFLHSKGKSEFEKLTHKEATRAGRHAFMEINDFPSWYEDLATAQPEAVRMALEEKVTPEWERETEGSLPYFLTRLDRPQDVSAPLLCPFLERLLRESDPPDPKVLQIVHCLLARVGTWSREEWSEMAQSRIGHYQPDEVGFKAWFLVWAQVDFQAATEFVERQNFQVEVMKRESNFVVSACADMLGRRGALPVFDPPDFLSSDSISKWIRFVYEWVDPEHDIVLRSGESYSPASRDDAQIYRSGLFEALANQEEPEFDLILERLLEDPPSDLNRSYLFYLFRRRKHRIADRRTWSEADFRNFADLREIAPRDLQELFQLSLRRLAAIQHDVEQAEESIRRHFRVEDKEDGLQSFLVRRMREISAKRYSIVRESQVDRGKHPDFQVHQAGIEGSIQGEIKFADLKERSGSNLLEGMINQLLGLYMRDEHSRYGVYVLGSSDPERRWEHPETGQKLDFPALISFLNEEASRIEKESQYTRTIQVVGIDFS